MARPVIMAVDDEPLVLNAVERDLRSLFGNEFQIIMSGSGADALETLNGLVRRGVGIALLVVDQRMPEMTGVEFLTAAMPLAPDARKVLLTAYADTEAAIASINEVGLDHYLMKPWEVERLAGVLGDLIEVWKTSDHTSYDGIRVAGTLWSAESHDVKDLLARNRIPYRWLDIDRDADAARLIETVMGSADIELPVVLLADGTVLANPSFSELAAAIGLHTEPEGKIYDLIIIGGGPAGLGAAVNGAAEGMETLLIERDATGGQAGTSSRIENYLGFPKGLSGSELAQRATSQAERLGAEILLTHAVTGIRIDDTYRYVQLDDGTELGARALIVATGVSVRRLAAKGVKRLTGAGIYYGAALTEAVNYRDRPVVIVGGANSAGQAAMLFSRYAESVTLLVRSKSLDPRMSQYLIDQISRVDNIEVRLRCELIEAHGENVLEAVTIEDKNTGHRETLPAAVMPVFIGASPHTAFLEGVVERTGAGFIPTGRDLLRGGKRPEGWDLRRDPFLLETSVPGIFAAGDVRLGSQPRVAFAVGSGGMAVGLVKEYLKTV